MIELYTTDVCPYCHKVMAALDEANITYETKNVGNDEAARATLLGKGGNMQVPFMIDTDTGTSMYESDNIISYVLQTYGQETST